MAVIIYDTNFEEEKALCNLKLAEFRAKAQ
jgi:hypothetical protein